MSCTFQVLCPVSWFYAQSQTSVRYTSPNEKFEYGYPHSNVLFNLYTSKTLYFVQNVSFVSYVNHYVDQSLATMLMTSGFRRYIAEYTVANSWRYPIRRRVIFSSALESTMTFNIGRNDVTSIEQNVNHS